MPAPSYEWIASWIEAHPELASAPVHIPARTLLFGAGQACQGFPLVLLGEVQVYRESAQGKRLELYRVSEGETCLVSTASLFSGDPLTAYAATTQASTLRMISPGGFVRMSEDPGVRSYLFGQFAQRLADLMAVTDAVAFQRLDKRLATALLGHGPVLALSHQDLANALGTAREIVTRLLRRFELEGWVVLGRSEIRIIDPRALRRFSVDVL
jgi:CRP/FNR family transcriptional regulator